jgi:tetratricopeptide (TPR) repeat protein
MTRISGAYINITPCCGTSYSTPRYSSMNFMAWEYWTDGYRDGSLMPNDEGLRRCQCGNVFLLSELQEIGMVEETDVPRALHVEADDLPKVIAQARTTDIELAARLALWQHLNHGYRQRYRAHRQAEEAATQAQWESSNPDKRKWWQRLRRAAAPKYQRPANAPFTCPPFEATTEQNDNMRALLQLMTQDTTRVDLLIVAELHRELGEFDQAAQALQKLDEKDRDITSQLMTKLVHEKQTAPVRYRM